MIYLMKCPLCGLKMQESICKQRQLPEYYEFNCKRCKKFLITKSTHNNGNVSQFIRDNGYKLSGISRERFEKGEEPPKFADENVIQNFLDEPRIKEIENDSYKNKSKILLEHFYFKFNKLGLSHFEQINCENDYPLAYAKDRTEFSVLIDELHDKGFLKNGPKSYQIRITQEGIEYLKELKGISEKGKPKKLKAEVQYIDESRISELENIKSCGYDFKRLVQMLKELNIAYNYECYISVAILVRAIIDHIPPFFNFKSFTELANNYGNPKKDKSFKDLMQHLDSVSRKIADMLLHGQIDKTVTKPTKTQVNFSPSLETLLGEIIEFCKEKEKNP